MTKGSRRQWSRLVSSWQESGLTCVEFARQAGVNPNTLAWWKWKLGTDGSVARGAGASGSLEAVSFVELTGAAGPSGGPGAAASGPAPAFVLHRGRYRVDIGGGFDERTLVRLLAVLDACA